MGTRVEQSGEFLPCAGRARRCHLEDMADSLHRLPSAAEELQVIISRSNRALLLQGEFRITLYNSFNTAGYNLDHMSNYQWIENYVPGGHASNMGALLDSAYLTEYGALFRTLLLRAKSDA